MSGVDTFLRDDGCEEEFCFSFDEERGRRMSLRKKMMKETWRNQVMN